MPQWPISGLSGSAWLWAEPAPDPFAWSARWNGRCRPFFSGSVAAGRVRCMVATVGCAIGDLRGIRGQRRVALHDGARFRVRELNLVGAPLDHPGGKATQRGPIAQRLEQAETDFFVLLLGPGEKGLARLGSALAIGRGPGERRRGGRGLSGRVRRRDSVETEACCPRSCKNRGTPSR